LTVDAQRRAELRAFVTTLLRDRTGQDEVEDRESLFFSGTLDSQAMTELVLFLEGTFGVDFSRVEFDVALLDSIDEIAAFVDQAQATSSPIG
jgi:acyl carrier protein